MAPGNVETYSEGNESHSRIQGDAKPFHTSDTKAGEVRAGREKARDPKVEHIIRKKDGRIGARNSYGHDPRNVHG